MSKTGKLLIIDPDPEEPVFEIDTGIERLKVDWDFDGTGFSDGDLVTFDDPVSGGGARKMAMNIRKIGQNNTTADRNAQQGTRSAAPRQPTTPRDFHNPYNFIPAPEPENPVGLEQKHPVGHHAWIDGLWSGDIDVTMTATTPLLIPEPFDAEEQNDHKTFRTRVDAEGRPVMPVTAFKGMLRSAYEAVTNSRLAIMDGKERLAYRESTDDARDAAAKRFPARVSKKDGKLVLELFIHRNASGDLKPAQAWLPAYGHLARALPNFRSGDRVRVNLAYLRYSRPLKKKRLITFDLWRVTDICVDDGKARPTGGAAHLFGTTYTDLIQPIMNCPAYVYATNQNFSRKHDERVFFDDGSYQGPRWIEINDEIERKWSELVRNYQATNEKVLREREGRNQQPDTYFDAKNPALSRHVYDTDGAGSPVLREGMMLYVDVVDPANLSRGIKGLVPVLVSRQLFERSPRDLLPQKLHPAATIDELSPADRVFGWAHEAGDGAYRGQLRIAPITCEKGGVEHFGNQNGVSLPLAILGQPKPQQWRFYGARNAAGERYPDGEGGPGYREGEGLRGRKVYPHHRGNSKIDGYWDAAKALRDASADNGTQVREYVRRRPKRQQSRGGQRDSQNRSMKDWVRPGTVFTTRMSFINLTDQELGALLWLLNLPEDHFHRFGGGKPLGFGSLRLTGEGRFWQAADKRTAIRSVFGQAKPTGEKPVLIAKFKEAMQGAYGGVKVFENIPFIAAFLKAAKGYDRPVHYPRLKGQQPANGETFKWFQENQKKREQTQSLEPLADDRGLTAWPDGSEKDKGGRGHRR